MLGIKNKKNKILLVEDDALLLNLLAKQLKKSGFNVEKVTNGLEVIPMAKSFRPDLILLDLILPGLDGFEILRNLREDNKLSDIPIVVLSNLDKEEDVKSTIALGAREHVVKVGVKLEDIIGIVKRNI